MQTVTKVEKFTHPVFAPETSGGIEVTLECLVPETVDEILQDVGGPEALITVYKRHKTQRAFNAAKLRYNNQIDNIPDGSEEGTTPDNAGFQKLIGTLSDASLKYKFDTSDSSITAKEAKDAILAAKSKVASLTPEERQSLSQEQALELLRSLGVLG